MKKILFFLFLCIHISTFAQDICQLEKELDGMCNVQFSQYDKDGKYVDGLNTISLSGIPTEKGNFYVSKYTTNSFEFQVFDGSYNLIVDKMVLFDLPEDYVIQSGYYSNQLTDAGDDYYILLLNSQSKYPYETMGCYKTAVFNSSGKLVCDLGSAAMSMTIYPIIWQYGGKYKFMIWTIDERDPQKGILYKTKVYTLNRSGKETALQLLPFGQKEVIGILDTNGNPVSRVGCGIQILQFNDGTTAKIVNK